VLDSQTGETPLVEDVRAWRAPGADGTPRVVVEGAWGRVAGPPPVLLVDDGARRHTLAALDDAPPDDPLTFRATFAVPAELAGSLDAGLALGVGRTEVPLVLGDPPAAGELPWLHGPPVIARRLTPRPVEQPADAAPSDHAPTPEDAAPADAAPGPDGPPFGEDLPMPPSRRFDRGASGASRGSIAAAILRATTPPIPEGATVVERSVIAERRARRVEQLAAVMERRARGAEDTAQELGERIAALEARIAELTAERDELLAELELQRATTFQAQSAREEAEARLADLLDRAQADGAGEIAAVRGLPGLQEAARAMRDQERARPEPVPAAEGGPDPFDSALAKLRANGEEDLAAAVAPAAPAEADTPAGAPDAPGASTAPAATVVAAVAARPLERVVPYLIAATHPRTPWLATAIAALDAEDRAAAALLVAQLLPDQARTLGRPLAYDLDLEGMDALRVELGADGSGRVLQRGDASGTAAFAVAASPAQFAAFAAGGTSWWPRGLRVGGGLMPFLRLAHRRRRHVTLADLVGAAVALDPGLAVRALASAVPSAWTAGHAFAVTLRIPGRDCCRVLVQDGAPLRVVGADEPERRTAVLAATTLSRPEGILARERADAVLGVTERGALPLLAQAEPPAGEQPAVVLGDIDAAMTLLRWFDRVQGLAPRA
jgi:hypothetical protein